MKENLLKANYVFFVLILNNKFNKTMCEITVTLRDITIKPEHFYDCVTREEVLDEVYIICQEAYNCNEDIIQSINIPEEFWADWEVNHNVENDNCD